MHEHPIANGPRENIAQLSHTLEMAMGQNRALLEDMARFSRDESLRLARMQLDHAGAAFAQLHERHDLGGLISAQQDWVKQTMQEYANLGLRYVEMFHGMTQQVQAQVKAAASDLQHQAEGEMENLSQVLQKDVPFAPVVTNGGHVHVPAE
jgi:hypothetical protein